MQRERKVRILRVKIRIPQIRRFSFTLNFLFMPKSVNCPQNSRHMGMFAQKTDNAIGTTPFLAQRFNEGMQETIFSLQRAEIMGK